jgi:hypothetical protein
MVPAIGATEQGSTPPRPLTEGIRMIHHVSIPAREPQHVAEVLAELMGGKCFPFGPLEGAFMAASGDAHGTMIEVYPERATLDIPDRDEVAPPAMAREYENFLKGAQTAMMSDRESLRLMRATHLKEPVKEPA